MTFDLKSSRINAGYTIRGLARELDVPEQTIRRLEAGRGISPANAKVIADFFEITVTDLLDLERSTAA